MKPHEETWEPLIWMHDGQQRPLWAIQSDHHKHFETDKVRTPFCEFEADEGPRAKLAAAAPEMARLLLELHREHGDRHTMTCPKATS